MIKVIKEVENFIKAGMHYRAETIFSYVADILLKSKKPKPTTY